VAAGPSASVSRHGQTKRESGATSGDVAHAIAQALDDRDRRHTEEQVLSLHPSERMLRGFDASDPGRRQPPASTAVDRLRVATSPWQPSLPAPIKCARHATRPTAST